MNVSSPGAAMTAEELRARIWSVYERGELVAVCAWCTRLRIDDVWVEPPAATLSTIDLANTLTHSICDSCTTGIQAA
jgi:hypothetical protein